MRIAEEAMTGWPVVRRVGEAAMTGWRIVRRVAEAAMTRPEHHEAAMTGHLGNTVAALPELAVLMG